VVGKSKLGNEDSLALYNPGEFQNRHVIVIPRRGSEMKRVPLAGIALGFALNASLFALASTPGQNTPASSSIEGVNAAVVAARAATKDKHKSE